MEKRPVKQVTAFVGHYGSGKTEVALNFAKELKKEYDKVCIIDMDIVNPYFRTKDAQAQMEEAGIRVIASEFAGSNVDIPTLPPEVHAIFDDPSYKYVLDIGGDEDGAIVLGGFARRLSQMDYDMFCVLNQRRPMTATPQEAADYIREIEAASRLSCTGLVNNTNLSWETTSEIVAQSVPYAQETATLTGKPVVMTTATQEVAAQLEGTIENLQPIRIHIVYDWE
jgi:hypothetical protein